MDNKYFPTVPNWGLESRKRSGTKVPRTQSGWDRPETQASHPPPTPVCSPSMVSTHLCEGDFLYLCSHTPPHPTPPPDTSISATQDSMSPCYATVLHQCWKREGTEEDPAGLKTCQVTPCLVIRGSFCPQDEVLPPAKAQSPAPATLCCPFPFLTVLPHSLLSNSLETDVILGSSAFIPIALVLVWVAIQRADFTNKPHTPAGPRRLVPSLASGLF